jgi:hypothetical protein
MLPFFTHQEKHISLISSTSLDEIIISSHHAPSNTLHGGSEFWGYLAAYYFVFLIYYMVFIHENKLGLPPYQCL